MRIIAEKLKKVKILPLTFWEIFDIIHHMDHGTRSMYNAKKCRCKECRQANTKYQINWQRVAYNSKPILHRYIGQSSRTPEYQCWANIKQRTTNPNNPLWMYYGKRGITMCQEWLNSFEEFYLYVGTRPLGLTLDRINNDKGYEPGNVRWITQKEQCSNRRKRKSISL